VKFANVTSDTNDDHSFAAHYQHYRGVIDSGVILGLRRYRFFGKLYFWLCITCLLDKLTVGAKMANKLYFWLPWSHLSIFFLELFIYMALKKIHLPCMALFYLNLPVWP